MRSRLYKVSKGPSRKLKVLTGTEKVCNAEGRYEQRRGHLDCELLNSLENLLLRGLTVFFRCQILVPQQKWYDWCYESVCEAVGQASGAYREYNEGLRAPEGRQVGSESHL